LIDAKRRLARVVCADLNEIREDEVFSIARQVMDAQVSDIRAAIHEISQRYSIKKIVACGLGEFLARNAVDEDGLEIILISEKYGAEISKVFPAYAAARLLKNEKI